MKLYTTYIFDLDGTITDTLAVWLDIFRDCLRHFGVTPPDDQTLSRHTHDWREMLKLGLPEKKLDAFTALAHKLANERLPKAPVHQGAIEALETLKNRGKRLAIFSTMDRPMFEPAMALRGLNTFVDSAVAGTDVAYRKPHPAGLLKTFENLGLTPNDLAATVYIGDKDTDIQAANSAGIDGILFYPASHQVVYDLNELKAHDPVAIINDWRELTAPFASAL
ncbi:MAG TPA: HAD-IA family hydrolase [Candidatus Saccharimonadales bacterium]|nr:HAD-IA family hydrolase [Candidatus Saccharimonadales bacterium]